MANEKRKLPDDKKMAWCPKCRYRMLKDFCGLELEPDPKRIAAFFRRYPCPPQEPTWQHKELPGEADSDINLLVALAPGCVFHVDDLREGTDRRARAWLDLWIERHRWLEENLRQMLAEADPEDREAKLQAAPLSQELLAFAQTTTGMLVEQIGHAREEDARADGPGTLSDFMFEDDEADEDLDEDLGAGAEDLLGAQEQTRRPGTQDWHGSNPLYTVGRLQHEWRMRMLRFARWMHRGGTDWGAVAKLRSRSPAGFFDHCLWTGLDFYLIPYTRQ